MKNWLINRDWQAFGLFVAMLAFNYALITAAQAGGARAASGHAAQAGGSCASLSVPAGAPAPAAPRYDGELI